jgi:hypothetical protein
MRWLCVRNREGGHSSAAAGERSAMTHRMAKILAAAIALGFGLETSRRA